MKILRIILCVLTFAFPNIVTSQPSNLPEETIIKLKAEVLQATISRNSAYEAANADLAFNFNSLRSGAIEAYSGKYYPISKESLLYLKEFFSTLNPGHIDIGSPQITILGSKSAITFIDGTWSYVRKKTKEEIGGPFIMTLVWVKENGAWKVIHKHESVPTKSE